MQGYFQRSNPGPKQLGSKYSDLARWHFVCHRQFPNATWEEHGFPEWPRTQQTNAKFGGWNMRPTNTFWGGGEFDPFRKLSPLSGASFAPKVRAFQKAPRCSKRQERNQIFGYVEPMVSHSHEFKTGWPELGTKARKIFTDALDEWLRCFRPRK